ncbi:MAG: Uma2 family endonuclease [Thermostichales cyanobacterium SZTDM-1c_bins_54]
MAVVDLSPLVSLDRQGFYRLCAANPDLKLERTAQGELVVMAPTGGETGSRNAELLVEVGLWNRRTGLGKVFDSSTGFALPNGADRSPDLAWIPRATWDALSPEERRGFLPVCPEFVVELLSPTDTWGAGQRKLEEYRACGCRLGWLIDPQQGRVAIYRVGQPVEILERPATLSGEEVLPGLEVKLDFLWG